MAPGNYNKQDEDSEMDQG
jgi:hypothetical protein